MPKKSEILTIEIFNWGENFKRKDLKRHHWFAMNNDIFENPAFVGLSPSEFRAWIYILCQASKQRSGVVVVHTKHAAMLGVRARCIQSLVNHLEQYHILSSKIRTEVPRYTREHERREENTDHRDDDHFLNVGKKAEEGTREEQPVLQQAASGLDPAQRPLREMLHNCWVGAFDKEVPALIKDSRSKIFKALDTPEKIQSKIEYILGSPSMEGVDDKNRLERYTIAAFKKEFNL